MRAILDRLPPAADAEVAFAFWGQSNARPWGHRDIEGFVDEPDLKLTPPGLDITIVSMAPSGAASHGLTGSKSTLTVAETLIEGELVGGEVRLWHAGYCDAFVTTRVGYGVVTANTASTMTVTWAIDWLQDGATVTFTNGTDLVNLVGHVLPIGTAVKFAGGTLPAELSTATTYYVIPVDADTFQLALSIADAHAGTPVLFTDDGTGPTTIAVGTVKSLPGYVHLHDLWKSYDNVRILTPYQPEQPVGYVAGPPVVPGYDFPPEVDGYSKTGLFLNYGWGEGIEGPGAVGASTATGLVTMTDTGASWTPNLFAGGYVRCGPSKAKILANTSDELTVDEWIPGQPAAVSSYEVHVPHHRDNPHHADPGIGMRYPSNDMQPGAMSQVGKLYNRPAGIITPSYVTSVFQVAPVATTVAGYGYARLSAVTAGAMTAAANGSQLRIQRADATSTPATGKIQFEAFVVPGYVVQLQGWTINSGTNINTLWRVAAVCPVAGGTGSYIDLDPIAVAVGTVDATCESYSAVDRYIFAPQYRFGMVLPLGYRLAQMLGRRVNMVVLGINGTSLMRRHGSVANGVCYNGKIGWWDDDKFADWTPANPDGLAARFALMLTQMAPAALQAEGSGKRLVYLGAFGMQGESDSMTVTGRELYYQMLAGFYEWLRDQIEAAGLSPYTGGARMPVVHPRITHVPWEIVGDFNGVPLTGDAAGTTNLAIERFAATDGHAATFNPDGSPKLDGATPFGTDYGHFNGHGEVLNAKTAAGLMLDLIDDAFLYGAGQEEIAVANEALAMVGAAPDVTTLEPPNDSEGARQAAAFLTACKRFVLQFHPWTFAQVRVSPPLFDDPVSTWLYCYVVPKNMLGVAYVLDPQAADDLQVAATLAVSPAQLATLQKQLEAASQPHRVETTRAGLRVLRTRQANAVLVYTSSTAPVANWDPHCRDALVLRLAAHLARALIKGKDGVALGDQFSKQGLQMLVEAAGQNAARQTDLRPEPRCDWLP